MDQQIILLNSQVTTSKQSARFQNWVGGVEGTLKQQNYQLKKLEFELAKQKYQKGEISSTVLMKKTQEYQIASQEFKAFINSLKMAD